MASSSGETIMAALLSLPTPHFTHLACTLSSDLSLQHRRLTFLLLSPPHFSQTLSYLHSLSLPQKTLLLARFLLRSLSKLLNVPPLASRPPYSLCLSEFDAALLLMTMCEVYDRNESSSSDGRLQFDWRVRIAQHWMQRALSPAELGAQGWGVVSRYVDAAAKCRRLLEVVTGAREPKAGAEVAASIATVVSLPSIECKKRGWECVVCKEDMEVGRDVCILPCEHGFHWGCILPWLHKRNTCPYCRFELPTDDVFSEIDRLWRAAVIMGQRSTTTSCACG